MLYLQPTSMTETYLFAIWTCAICTADHVPLGRHLGWEESAMSVVPMLSGAVLAQWQMPAVEAIHGIMLWSKIHFRFYPHHSCLYKFPLPTLPGQAKPSTTRNSKLPMTVLPKRASMAVKKSKWQSTDFLGPFHERQVQFLQYQGSKNVARKSGERDQFALFCAMIRTLHFERPSRGAKTLKIWKTTKFSVATRTVEEAHPDCPRKHSTWRKTFDVASAGFASFSIWHIEFLYSHLKGSSSCCGSVVFFFLSVCLFGWVGWLVCWVVDLFGLFLSCFVLVWLGLICFGFVWFVEFVLLLAGFFFFVRLFVWLGGLVGLLGGWWLVVWFSDGLVICWSFDRLVVCLVGWLVGWLFGWLVGWLVSWLVDWFA